MAFPDWIKVESTTPTKIEVVRIAAAMKINPYEALGRLIQLWIWADSNTTNGKTFVEDLSSIDFVAGLPGFGSAMQKVGWLLQDGDGYTFPNFDRHNGNTAKKRAEDARKKKLVRTNVSKTEGHLSQNQQDILGSPSSSTSLSMSELNSLEGGVGETEIESESRKMAQEFWEMIPVTNKSSVSEFAASFSAKVEWLEANGRGAEKAKIWAEIRNPKRDREVVNTTNKMFKFWPGCGLDTSQPDQSEDIAARTLKRLKEQEAQELAKKRSA